MKGEWEMVSTIMSMYLKYDKQKHMESIILLSYNKLPHDLRDRSLYFGIFPKDTEIPAYKLIRLWIAEGFMQPKLEKT